MTTDNLDFRQETSHELLCCAVIRFKLFSPPVNGIIHSEP